MGAQLRFGTAGATGGGFSAQPGTLQPALDESRHEPRWSWQARSPKTWKDKIGWNSKWSFGCRTSGGGEVSGLDGASAIGQSLADKDLFEPYSCDGEGTQTLKWIKGQCVDVNDAPLSGVNVAAFRTSDNAVAGITVQSREDGSYDVPTMFPGVDHFVRAYLDGSPDRTGVTLDTLQPTNIDGT